jgi:hypothetical protein
LAKRKSEKALDFGNVDPSWIGGPKTGTSFDLLTATLNPKHHYISKSGIYKNQNIPPHTTNVKQRAALSKSSHRNVTYTHMKIRRYL